jgi:rhodanese-related sulfurtransferase
MPSEINTTTAVPEVPEISREELRQGLANGSFKVVDVLPAESYAAGHIPGAMSLPTAQIAGLAAELLPEPNAAIVVYCAKFT